MSIEKQEKLLDSLLEENVRLGGFNLLSFPVFLLAARSETLNRLEIGFAAAYLLFFVISSIAYGVIVVALMKKKRNIACYEAFGEEWSAISGQSYKSKMEVGEIVGALLSVGGSSGRELNRFIRNLKPWRDRAYLPQIGMIGSFLLFCMTRLFF